MEYTIGEIAKKCGISSSALRYYDRLGLLPFMNHKPGVVRKFGEADLEWLEIIHNLKEAGMPVKKIKSYIDMCMVGDATLERRLQFMQEHMADLERRVKTLRNWMGFVRFKLWYYETAIKGGSESVHQGTEVHPYKRYLKEKETEKQSQGHP